MLWAIKTPVYYRIKGFNEPLDVDYDGELVRETYWSVPLSVTSVPLNMLGRIANRPVPAVSSREVVLVGHCRRCAEV